MLTLINPQYQSPTGYTIVSDPDFQLPNAASLLYTCIESLKKTGWFGLLAQYGIKQLDWRGELEETAQPSFQFTPNTIHIMLPRSPGSVPGFETEWSAYHQTMSGVYVFAWCPYTGNQGDWLTGATHELMEALTDAEPGQGWVNTAKDDEGADDCETGFSLSIPGFPSSISSYWLNNDNRCLVQSDI